MRICYKIYGHNAASKPQAVVSVLISEERFSWVEYNFKLLFFNDIMVSRYSENKTFVGVIAPTTELIMAYNLKLLHMISSKYEG